MTPEQIKIVDNKIKCACEGIDKHIPAERILGFLLDAHNILEHEKNKPPTKPKFKEYKLLNATHTGALEAMVTDHILKGWKIASSMLYLDHEFIQPMILEE
jgi:hypothetical protein